MLVTLGLCVLSIVVIATHDYLLDRAEFDSEIAYFKSTIFAGSQIGNLTKGKFPSLNEGAGPPSVTVRSDGLFHVESWMDEADEAGAVKRTPYECTLECFGLDHWRVVDLKIGDGPVVVLNKSYGATGQFNRYWSRKVSKLFEE